MQLSVQISEQWIKRGLLIFKAAAHSIFVFPAECVLFSSVYWYFAFWFQRKVKHVLDLCVNVFVILFFGLFLFWFTWIGFWYCLKWFVNYFRTAGHGWQRPPPAIQDRSPYLWKKTHLHFKGFLFRFFFARHHVDSRCKCIWTQDWNIWPF